MKWSKTISILLATVLCLCLLSGCGDTEDPNQIVDTPPENGGEVAGLTLNEEGAVDLKATGLVTYSFGEEQEEDWAANIEAVYLRESDSGVPAPVTEADLLATDQYTISTVKMMLDSSLFPLSHEESKTYEVTVQSAGYDDYLLGLTVSNRTPASFVLREIDGSGNVLKTVEFSYDELAALCTTESYVSIGCVMHGLVSLKAEGIYLDELFELAGIEFGPGMSLATRATDAPTSIEATETNTSVKTGVIFDNPEQYWMKPRYTDNYKLTYEDLYERPRYFLTAVWEDPEIGTLVAEDGAAFSFEAREALASNPDYMTEVKPMIAWKYTSLEYNSNPADIRTVQDENYDLTANERAFRFLYGLALDNDPTVNVTAYDDEAKEYPVVVTPEYAGRTAIEDGDDACGISARNAMLVFGIDVFVDGE